LQCWGS